MEGHNRKTSEVYQEAIGNRYSLEHHAAYSSRQPVPVQYTEGYGLANTRLIPPHKYAFPQNCLTGEHSAVMYGHQLRMRMAHMPNSSARYNLWPRVKEDPEVQKIKIRNVQLQLQSMKMIGGNRVSPNALNPSLNTSRTFPADERQHHMTDEEYFVAMGRQKSVTGTWPVRHSCSNSSNYGTRVRESTKVLEVKSREDQHQFLRHIDTRKGYVMHPNAHYSFPNTSQIPPASDGWYYPATKEEYNLFMSPQQLRMGTWPEQNSTRNSYSDIGLKVHENAKVQETKLKEDHRQFLQGRDSGRRGDIMHPNTQQPSPNTRQILHEEYIRQHCRDEEYIRQHCRRDEEYIGQHCRRDEEYNLVKARRQLRRVTWPERDSKRNAESNVTPTVCKNSPKDQEIKFSEDLRRRKSQNKEINNHIDNPTDRSLGKSFPAQEPSPQEWFDNLHKSGVTEDYWILLYTKGSATCVGLYGVICLLLPIAVIMLGLLLCWNVFHLFLESLDPS